MDTGKGYFEMVDDEKIKKMNEENIPVGPLFQVGEELEIKGSRFRITYIRPDRMTLTLLPKE